MPALALDCSFAGLSLGLFPPSGAPAVFTSATPRSSDILHTQLLTLFEKSNQNPANLTHITLTLGPGSFTGCRIGLATAQAFQVVNPSIHIIGVATLQALACQIAAENPTNNQPISIVLDAAGNHLYHQAFSPSAQPLAPATCGLAAEILAAIPTTHLLAAPTSLLLPRQPGLTFSTINPLILHQMSQTPAHHLPLQPIYLKPLNYQTAANHA
ncbi:MAG: tRNA (adenosine(37)-N6)-threonylcarbamoyltransferase complex dimerization subunit type 1 TsaB [Proteobacteria bacterium]|nr:tRNA (adenosine(37)-N6)-threonylcarbamoyltransferase complex dimerization subunit type 1 TsaB [Pseudomonadota bacterium]